MTGTERFRTYLDGLPQGWDVAVHPERQQPYTVWYRGHVVLFTSEERAAILYTMTRAQARSA